MPNPPVALPEKHATKPPLVRYGFATTLTVAAFACRQVMDRLVGAELPPYITFYPAVMAIALLAGFGPGLLATLAAGAMAICWILPPQGRFAVEQPHDVFGLIVFVSMGLIMSWVAELYRRARDRSATYARELVLRETTDFNRQIINSAREGIIVLDRDLRYQVWNPFMEVRTGVAARDLLGKQPWEVLSEFPELKELTDGLHWGLRGEEISFPDLPLTLPRGAGQAWFSVTTNPLRNLQGEITGVVAVLHDITGHKQAGEALRKSEQRYRSLFENMLEGYALCEMVFEGGRPTDFVYLDVNSAFEELAGLKGVVGRRASEVIPGIRETNPELLEIYGAVATTGEPRRCQIYLQALGIWFAISAYSPKQGYFACVFDNITDRKRAEETLQLQATALRATANAVVITDPAGNIQWANLAFARLTGYFADEFVGKNPRLLRSGVHDQAFYKDLWDTILAGQTWEGEVTNRRKDGSLCTVHQTITPVRDDNDMITNFVAIHEDVTERKRAEEALLRSEERFSKAFRSSPLASAISTESEGRYLDVNDAFLQLCGYGREQVIGRTVRDLNLWEQPHDRVEMVRKLGQAGRVTGVLARYNTCRGEIREVNVAADRIDLDGQPCVLSISQDVTETRRLEAQLRQAQKMEAMGRLSGGVAHDFNNLLGIMMGYAELASDQVDPSHPVAKRLAEIRNAGQRAAALVRQLLAFSRQQVVFPQNLDLNAVINDIAKMLARVIGEDVTLTLTLADSLAAVRADKGQIEQILMNLAVNARDAMARGGRLMIETANVELDADALRRHPEARPGDYVLLSVSDNGSGMDKETLPHIFEPFFTTKAVGRGTGLGLATVYGIVKQSNGYVWVYSEPGNGTSFKIYLPSVEKAVLEAAEPQPEAPCAAGRECILLVEDDDAFRALTASTLQSAGYTVVEAGAPDIALGLLQEAKQSIDLLLTDVIMPKMAGSDLARQAQRLHPGLPVLFMSGYAGDLLAQYGPIRREQVVEKPFTRRTLLAKVDGILHRHNHAD